VTESPAPAFVADGEAVGKVLAACSGLTAIRYAAYGAKVDLAVFGLDTPTTTLALTLRPPPDDKSAKSVVHTIVLGKPAEGTSGGRYARVDNGAGVVVLGPTAVTELTHGYLDFVNRKIWQFDAKTVASLQRHSGNESLELTKEQTGWQLVKPAARRADDTTLDELVTALATLRAKRVAAYPAQDLKPFGLDAPTAVLTLRSAKPEEFALKIGKVADESSGDRYAMADGSTVVVLPGTLSRQLLGPELHFRDHTLARLGDIDRITLERGARKATFVQADGTWSMKEPAEAPVELTELKDFVRELATLRADDLVAERPAELKTYGLDRPEVRWHFRSGEKELLDLQIGGRQKIKEDNKETEGPRCYAKIGTGDVVFLLSPALTTKVMAEYRQRTVWAPLDAVQIDKLSYGSLGNGFVLERVDNTWRVAGKPELQVNADMIRETLDALAGLKAARYVADKGTELKLYGLEPPQLVLEIHTQSGKRTLHIGRPEGESKRYYARVFTGSDAPVFIIAETDAGRILRTLADFGKDAAKVSAVR
jgi:hypothetical protein